MNETPMTEAHLVAWREIVKQAKGYSAALDFADTPEPVKAFLAAACTGFPALLSAYDALVAERERELESAFVAGFKESQHGYNGEWPFAQWPLEEIRAELRPEFEDWLKTRALAALKPEQTT